MTHTCENGTSTQVSDSTTSAEIRPINPDRKGLIIHNASTAVMYLLLGSGTASATNYTYPIQGDDTLEVPNIEGGRCYKGPITAVWSADTAGFAMVWEGI